MIMGWSIYKLCNLCEITSSKRIFYSEYTASGVPFYRSKEIIDFFNRNSIATELYISKSRYNEIKFKFGVPVGDDLLLTSVGTIGIPYLVKASDKFYFKDGNLIWFRNYNLNLIDPLYLFLWISSDIGKQNLNILSMGAAQPALTISRLKNLALIIPPIQEQHKIASILSVYDSLIENNTKRIRLLEQMAENLYKEWFVRFRFPGYEKTEFVESKLGRLPATFQVTNMSSVFEYYIGGGWGNDDYSEDYPIEASVIRGADFPSVWRYDLSSCPRRYHKISNYKTRQLKDGDIIMEISGGTSEQPVGRSVLVTQDMIDRFKEGRVICASFCKLIRLKRTDISPYFFYYWMRYLYDTRIIDRFQLQSTGIINFKFEAFLRKGLVLLPSMDIMNKFESQIIPIIKGINKLAMQNENLTRQRDALLPRLMSGILEVKA